MNPLYETLGKTKEERQISYRDFVVEENNILKGQFYGSNRFIADMERKYGVKKFPAKKDMKKQSEKENRPHYT